MSEVQVTHQSLTTTVVHIVLLSKSTLSPDEDPAVRGRRVPINIMWQSWDKRIVTKPFIHIIHDVQHLSCHCLFYFTQKFNRFKPVVWWTSINRYHGFHALAKRRFFPRFSSTRRKISAFKPCLQYYATGSDTASCQDYEEYEFVACLSEEIKIIDLFAHCKLQPHKLSQYTLASPLSSWYLDSIR